MDFVRRRFIKNEGKGLAGDHLAVDVQRSSNVVWNQIRHKNGILRCMQCVFLLSWMLQGTNFLSVFVGKGLVVVGACFVIHRLLKFQRWNDEIAHVFRFAGCAVFMAGVLATENFFVWVVSASDLNRNKKVAGLQDNVELLVKYMMKGKPSLHSVVMFRWADIRHFLGVTIALAVSVLWNQVPYSGFGMMSRVVLTIGVSHLIRMVCFLVTIVPSPKPGCYMRRFPPVPDNWRDFISIGIDKMKGSGGCNDLIFSGHCAIWILAPLAYHSYYKGQGCWLLWTALLQTCIRTVMEHHHYSVDMVIAAVVVPLVWRELDWVYPSAVMLPERPQGTPGDPPDMKMVMAVVIIIIVVVWFVIKSGS